MPHLHSVGSNGDDILSQPTHHVVENNNRWHFQCILVDHPIGMLKIELVITHTENVYVLGVLDIIEGNVHETLFDERCEKAVLFDPFDHFLRAVRHYISIIDRNNLIYTNGATSGFGHKCFAFTRY